MSEERPFPTREQIQAILDGESRDVRIERGDAKYGDRVVIVGLDSASLARQAREAILTLESRNPMRIPIAPTAVSGPVKLNIDDLVGNLGIYDTPDAIQDDYLPAQKKSATPQRFQRDWRKIKPGRR